MPRLASSAGIRAYQADWRLILARKRLLRRGHCGFLKVSRDAGTVGLRYLSWDTYWQEN